MFFAVIGDDIRGGDGKLLTLLQKVTVWENGSTKCSTLLAIR